MNPSGPGALLAKYLGHPTGKGSVNSSFSMAPWCSGLTRFPVKEEIVGSNPIGVAIAKLSNGRTHGSDPCSLGSNPSFAATLNNFSDLKNEDHWYVAQR